MTSTVPDWALNGLPRWTLVFSLPLCLSLLIQPAVSDVPGSDPPGLLPVAALVAAAVLFIGTVASRYRPGTERLAHLMLAGLAVLAVTTTLAWSTDWSSLFALLVVATGIAVVNRIGPLVILAGTLLAVTVELLADTARDADPVSAALIRGLTLLLTGLHLRHPSAVRHGGRTALDPKRTRPAGRGRRT